MLAITVMLFAHKEDNNSINNNNSLIKSSGLGYKVHIQYIYSKVDIDT